MSAPEAGSVRQKPNRICCDTILHSMHPSMAVIATLPTPLRVLRAMQFQLAVKCKREECVPLESKSISTGLDATEGTVDLTVWPAQNAREAINCLWLIRINTTVQSVNWRRFHCITSSLETYCDYNPTAWTLPLTKADQEKNLCGQPNDQRHYRHMNECFLPTFTTSEHACNLFYLRIRLHCTACGTCGAIQL